MAKNKAPGGGGDGPKPHPTRAKKASRKAVTMLPVAQPLELPGRFNPEQQEVLKKIVNVMADRRVPVRDLVSDAIEELAWTISVIRHLTRIVDSAEARAERADDKARAKRADTSRADDDDVSCDELLAAALADVDAAHAHQYAMQLAYFEERAGRLADGLTITDALDDLMKGDR